MRVSGINSLSFERNIFSKKSTEGKNDKPNTTQETDNNSSYTGSTDYFPVRTRQRLTGNYRKK